MVGTRTLQDLMIVDDAHPLEQATGCWRVGRHRVGSVEV